MTEINIGDSVMVSGALRFAVFCTQHRTPTQVWPEESPKYLLFFYVWTYVACHWCRLCQFQDLQSSWIGNDHLCELLTVLIESLMMQYTLHC